MGTKPRYRPKNLGRKLFKIRDALGLSQSEMLRRLGAEELSSTARISEFELDIREPSLWVLLAYGRVARVHLEIIIDDEAVLPEKIPGNFDYRRITYFTNQ
jgi:transcriptional regulator with XRE-family HTH domain